MSHADYNEELPPLPRLRPRSAKEALQAIDVQRQWWDSVVESQFRLLCSHCYPEGVVFGESRPAAVSALRNQDPIARYVALYALRYIWDLSHDVAEICHDLIKTDSHDGVKGLAIQYCSDFFSGRQHLGVAKDLATIVASQSLSDELRTMAYCGLMKVLKGSTVSKHETLEGFRFPRDVDWHIVQSLLAADSRRAEENKGDASIYC